MASRKYLTIIVYPFCALSNPWIPEDGIYKYSATISKYNIPIYYKNELAQYHLLEREKILLQNEMHLLEMRNLLDQEYARNEENKNRLEQFRLHRKSDLQYKIHNIKSIQDLLYLDYKLGDYNSYLEYGYGNDSSFGISGNFTHAKLTQSQQFALFYKYKLYEKKHRILTIKPYLYSDGTKIYPGAKIILGNSKKAKSRWKILNHNIYHYASFGIEDGPYNAIYEFEYQIGVKLKYDLFFIAHSKKRLEKNPSKLYRHLFRKEYKVAKEFSRMGSKIGISLGYFTDLSISAKRLLSDGYILGIWGEF